MKIYQRGFDRVPCTNMLMTMARDSSIHSVPCNDHIHLFCTSTCVDVFVHDSSN